MFNIQIYCGNIKHFLTTYEYFIILAAACKGTFENKIVVMTFIFSYGNIDPKHINIRKYACMEAVKTT